MNALEQFRSRLAVGTKMVCVGNTYIPGRAGVVSTLTKVGKRFADCTADENRNCYMSLPTRARDVEWLDQDTVKWALGSKPARLIGHTVTYRFIDQEAS